MKTLLEKERSILRAQQQTQHGTTGPGQELPKSSILVDTGNFLFKTAQPKEYAKPYYQLKAAYVARAYDVLGFDCAVLSDIDFALGEKVLSSVLDERQFAVLAGNLKLHGKPFYPGFHLVRTGGGYVGIIGMLSSLPRSLKQEERELSHVSEELNSILQRIDGFCDLSILLLSGNRQEALTIALNKIGRRPDIILYGDNRFGTGVSEIVGETLLIEGAGLGRYLGKLTISPSLFRNCLAAGTQASGIELEKGYTCEFLPVAPFLKREECAGALADEYKKEVRDLSVAISRKASQSAHSSRKHYWGKELCAGCHPKQQRIWKTTAHAHAFATLEKIGRDTDVECLPCHTLGFQEPKGYTNPLKGKEFADVQCEGCHGPGVDHGKPAYSKTLRDKKMCLKCHDQEKSPDFDYKDALRKGSCLKIPTVE